MTQHHTATRILALALLALCACSEDPAPTPTPKPDMATQVDMRADQPGDIDLGPKDMDQADMAPIDPEARVAIDLSPYTSDAPPSQVKAKVFEATSQQDIPSGVVALGRPGDWVLENEHIKVVIETEQRAMSPCPYGGNIIDGAYIKDGVPTSDNIGELCLFLNVGQTLLPERYEVVNDGADGQAAVLAVTGRPALLDFLNFKGMARDVAGLTLNLPIDPDQLMPITITIYYILHPGSRAVRVVTALRNHGPDQEHILVSHILSGGADGKYFNPTNGLGGFGYVPLDTDNLDGFSLPFLAFNGSESSYAYAPTPDPGIGIVDGLPSAGVYMSISGASATLLGRPSLVKTLLTSKSRFPSLSGAQHLKTGEVGVIDYRFYVGDSSLSTMLDHIYKDALGLEVGRVSGVVTEANDQPAVGVTVTALDDQQRAINQVITGADGRYVMSLPASKTYALATRGEGRVHAQPSQVTITADQEATQSIKLKAAATLTITVKDAAGQPTPARVSVLCEQSCPEAPGANERDITTDNLPGGFIKIEPTDLDGKLTLELAPGAYRVVVSRGMEWSTWPSDAYMSNGQAVILQAGSPTLIDAEIAHVLSTPGVLSGDFHIHSAPSTDSAAMQRDRVMSYIMEGVDVMVSTDHDIISDFGPTIGELGAQREIASIVGLEVTTSDTGHFNAFPLQANESERRRGALDWADGEADSLLPQEIYDWMDQAPGEQVIQINHPAGAGTIGALKVDTLRGISLANPDGKRLPVLPPDAVTGDTRLWSESFTAMEIMNGHRASDFWMIMRWWLTMVGRGFTPTATAVTDTHQLHGNLGGSPRSFVFVGAGKDDIENLDTASFVTAINQGRLIGSNGPFFSVELVNMANERAALGQTLASQGQSVQAQLNLELPEWLMVDTIDVYMNAADTVVAPGEENGAELAPTLSVPVTFTPEDLEVVATGQFEHKRWRKSVQITLDTPVDAYVVFVVRGKAQGSSMWPVLPNRGIKPLAFSNPIFIDADGQGYDKPHLAGAAKTPAPYNPEVVTFGSSSAKMLRWPHIHNNQNASPWTTERPDVPSVVTEFGLRPLTAQDIAHIIEVSTCKH